MTKIQDRTTLTEENGPFWLLKNSILHDTSPEFSQPQSASVNEVLHLIPGDHIWLARRSRAPKVLLLSKHLRCC